MSTMEPKPAVSDHDTGLWAMALHLSQFANLAPLAGIIVPIVIWQLKKSEMPALDAHGRNVINWVISAYIYAFVGFLLLFVLIGIPFLSLLAILCVVFPVIGAIKASNGEVWKYPLAIPFL